MSYDEVYKKGLEVGWSGLSVQEHAVLLFHKITEEKLCIAIRKQGQLKETQ
jgi:hypothetical protein